MGGTGGVIIYKVFVTLNLKIVPLEPSIKWIYDIPDIRSFQHI